MIMAIMTKTRRCVVQSSSNGLNTAGQKIDAMAKIA
jgi:hypothetical protein